MSSGLLKRVTIQQFQSDCTLERIERIVDQGNSKTGAVVESAKRTSVTKDHKTF